MSIIQVQDLSFTYPGSYAPVFEQLSFHMDTDWRLGLVGRNGRGKTTLLRLLSGALQGTGRIVSSVRFTLFPFDTDASQSALACMRAAVAPFDAWEKEMAHLCALGDEASLLAWGEIEQPYAALSGYAINELLAREAGRMAVDPLSLDRPLGTFSPGEQTRLLLAALFLKKQRFLLIDEPTNHLDTEGRRVVARYLSGKRGFLLVSHDRWFLDASVDHILALHKTGAWVSQGDYSTYRAQKLERDAFERQRNEKLTGEITRLTETSRDKRAWSDRVEATKVGTHAADRGAIGHKAAKMMKRALVLQKRTEDLIESKKALLRDVEYASDLSLHPLAHPARILLRAYELTAGYDKGPLFAPLTFELAQGARVALRGPNGAGKSTLLAVLRGEMEPLSGRLTRSSGLVLSIMAQQAHSLTGTPQQLARARGLSESYFLMLLRKLDFPREAFTRDMADYSMGQRKKVLLAASMAAPAHLYLWDEPLNYMDVESREQIEGMLAQTPATLLLVEHDQAFIACVATEELVLLPMANA